MKNTIHQRNEYLPLATHVSKLFDILTKLKHVHPAYQFNFTMVTRLLVKILKESVSLSKNIVSNESSRIDDLCRTFTKSVNDEIAPSVFTGDLTLKKLCCCLKSVYVQLMFDTVVTFRINFLLFMIYSFPLSVLQNNKVQRYKGRLVTSQQKISFFSVFASFLIAVWFFICMHVQLRILKFLVSVHLKSSKTET